MNVTIICPRCQGSGDIQFYNENDYDCWMACPACGGNGRIEGELVEERGSACPGHAHCRLPVGHYGEHKFVEVTP